MCYSIPGKIEQINGNIVTVNYFGEQKRAVNELLDVKVGDYIYAQGGFVIQKIESSRAGEILSAWEELFVQLREVDLRLSSLNLKQKQVTGRLKAIIDNACAEKPLNRQEAAYLLGLSQKEHLGFFYDTANFLRRKYHNNACCVHGIIEISNYCQKNCLYCGIRAENKNLKRYRMTKEQIVNACDEAVNNHGFKALVLQSGEDPAFGADELSEIIKDIKKKVPALIFISFGELGIEGLQKIFDAGARGLLMRFETSNPDLYQKMRPECSLDTRLLHIKKAYETGYLIITGGLIGLPGQSLEDLISDIHLAGELKAEMFSFGPFLPHPDTPLCYAPAPTEDDVLKILALSRLMKPKDTKVLITTAFETLSKNARKSGLMSGGTSVMLNATPMQLRNLYSIYPNRAHEKETIEFQVKEIASLLKSIGRVPVDLGTGVGNLS